MKFKVFVHPYRPKVKVEKFQKIIQSLGSQVSETDPDIALVIGGDGTFSHYGKKLSIPMLFVGVPSDEILGSKSRLADIFIQDFTDALRKLLKGKYLVAERRMLDIGYGTSPTVSVLTDVYLERGLFAGCIRYSLSIFNQNLAKRSFKLDKPMHTDYVIGNGVIISTSVGSSGYYSYMERLTNPNEKLRELFDDDRLGVCHILPTYAVRLLKKKVNFDESVPVRYTVPDTSTIQMTVLRQANIRLYGTTIRSQGIKIPWNKPITVASSSKTAKIIHIL